MESRKKSNEQDEQPALPLDDIYLVSQQLPPTSKALSALCLHSTPIHAATQDKRLRTLFATLFTTKDTEKLSSNLQAIGKILQIRPDLVNCKIDLNAASATDTPEQQRLCNQTVHYNFLICLVQFAAQEDGAAWVKAVLTCLANNGAYFDGRNEYGFSIIHHAVKMCASDVIAFLYDHQLIDTTAPDLYLLDILQTSFSEEPSNWKNRKTHILHRLCVEHPFLFYRDGELIDSRSFSTFLYYLNRTYKISNNTYCDDRYYLTQFYLHQLTEMTPQELFNRLIKQSRQILAHDIPKLLDGTLKIETSQRLFEILKLILLTDYSPSQCDVFKIIGAALHRTPPEIASAETKSQYKILAVIFICAAGHEAMREPAFAALLHSLINTPEIDVTLTLDEFVCQYPHAVLTCIDEITKFYSEFTGKKLDPLESHPLTALQNFVVHARMQQNLVSSHMLSPGPQ